MGANGTPQQLGKYILYERLGRGGMAEVWKALDTQLRRYVAIKILSADLRNDPQFSTRFLREAQVVASLRHPNIVQIYDFQIVPYPDVKEPLAYMVMDYVAGQNLADYIAATSWRGKFPSPEDIVYLFRIIGHAIDYAHQKGIIHRDIKPANILLDQRATAPHGMGEPVLTDFGLVKLMSSPGMSLKGVWLGTPLYTSPEQAQGLAVDACSDIYSLGVILYEICTGIRPFSGNTATVILRQHIIATPPAPERINPAISPALTEVILRCLAKDPQARFPTASALATALAQAVKTTPLTQLASPFASDQTSKRVQVDPHINRSVLPTVAREVLTSPPTSPPPDVQAASQLVSPLDSQESTLTSLVGTSPYDVDANLPPTPTKAGEATVSVPLSPTMQPPILKRAKRRQRKGFHVGVLVSILTMLIGSTLGLAAFFWSPQSGAASSATSPIVGNAFFVSSGKLSASGIPSINDELLIHLRNLRDPAPGKVYYGWLLRDKKQLLETPIPLGVLTVKQGAVDLLYPGVPQRVNLLAITSRLLITEEDANLPPMNPAPDFSTVRYYAELPQAPDPNDASHFSQLDHLRRLLAQDPAMMGQKDRYSNLDIWLMEQTGRVLEWANSARDYWNNGDTQLMRPQFSRILNYLDGDSDVQADLPVGMASPNIAPVALLGSATPDIHQPLSADYLHQVSDHLTAMAQAPGATSEQRVHIAHINVELNNVRNWLEQVRQDARQLIQMSDAQLLTQEAMTLMDKMVMQAFYAYVGQLDPATGEVQGGVVQINNDIERLAAFDIVAYTAR